MRKNVIKKISLQVVLLFLAMLYGMLIVRYQFPPYSLLKNGYSTLKSKAYSETPKEYGETDVAKLISIRQSQDVNKRRGELVRFLWGRPEIPLSLPSTVDKQFTDHRYKNITYLHHMEKITINMEYGLESIVYHLIPKNPNNKVILYHQGHGGDFYKSKEQIKLFIKKGFTVVAFSMPLLGLNNQPTIQVPHIGKLKLTTHDHLKFISPKNGHPVKFFIEPVVIVLNYLKDNFAYTSVSMVGISGGGWTTTLAAAVDTRIIKSFPVAGSYPIYLRSNSPRDWGDYEQLVPELYKTVNYLELYVLGASGQNRKQLQIINKYDACCFAGMKWNTYKDIVRSRVNQLGAGEFDLYLDDSHHGHLISDVAMGKIIEEIDSD